MKTRYMERKIPDGWDPSGKMKKQTNCLLTNKVYRRHIKKSSLDWPYKDIKVRTDKLWHTGTIYIALADP